MKNLKFLLKPLLIILVLICALGLIGYLNQSTPPTSFYRLFPAQETSTLGQEFEVEIVLQTVTEINAADAVLQFDPQILQVVEIKPGKIFPLYPRKKIDPEKGSIAITGVKTRKDGQVFTKPLVFATLVLKGKEKGKANLNFVFSKGKTTGSTIIKAEGSENILEKVYNGSYEIK